MDCNKKGFCDKINIANMLSSFVQYIMNIKMRKKFIPLNHCPLLAICFADPISKLIT